MDVIYPGRVGRTGGMMSGLVVMVAAGAASVGVAGFFANRSVQQKRRLARRLERRREREEAWEAIQRRKAGPTT